MRAAVLALAVALAAGCSSSSTPTSSPHGQVSPSASPVVHDAYSDLAPPTSPGVGDFSDLVANHAYVAAQGFLAAQLLEPAALSGVGDKDLAALIQGAAGDPAPARALTGTRPAGLRFRPLLAKGVLLPKDAVTVVRSEYVGEEVSGLGGGKALRITWSGALHYRVEYQGKPYAFAYASKIAYVFSPDTVDRAGVTLQVTIPEAVHIAPAQTACLAEGVVLPVPGAITEVDDSEGPWPRATPGPACPVQV